MEVVEHVLAATDLGTIGCVMLVAFWGSPGALGRWRRTIEPDTFVAFPLGSCRWDTTDVKLQVQKTGIRTITAYKPDKK